MAGTIVADTIQNGAGNSTSMDNAIYGSAKAWVNFNPSSGTAVIRASYNVTSVTVNSTAVYTIAFTNALSDANYCFTAACSEPTAGVSAINFAVGPDNGSYSTWVLAGSLKIQVKRSDASNSNPDVVNIAVFR